MYKDMSYNIAVGVVEHLFFCLLFRVLLATSVCVA